MSKLRLEQIASGIECDMKKRFSFLAHTEQKWERYWKEFFHRREAPEYDFSKASILGVCYGRTPLQTLIRILHVEELKGELEVDVGYWIGKDDLVCQPYHFVRIPKTRKNASFSYRKVGRTALGLFLKSSR